MVRNMTVAQELGYLKVPADTLIELKQLENYPDDKVVMVSTGSQGGTAVGAVPDLQPRASGGGNRSR